jgi:ankyrin repeat protein
MSRFKMISAIRKGSPELVKALLDEGFNPNENSDCPVIDDAVSSGNREIVELLLKANASLTRPNIAGMTPLYAASPDLVAFLVERGADIHFCGPKGSTPLHRAVANDVGKVRALLAAGAHVDAVDSENRTPLHQACGYAYKMPFKVLLRAGANVNAVTREGVTPLMEAVKGGEKKRLEIVQDLIVAGAIVNAVGYSQRNAFLYACEHGASAEVVRELVNAGANVNQQTALGQSGWELAERNDRMRLLPILKELGLQQKL